MIFEEYIFYTEIIKFYHYVFAVFAQMSINCLSVSRIFLLLNLFDNNFQCNDLTPEINV